ncbi:hypothetical protein VSS37_03140 [Candidatus Thiothrix sp. Deng01]|uniref:Pepco domain-containing protein n=1 Tax=Candidatus Thiothrix phosphatis TaxID=3112415 RepID=A0ABU6CT77_9GAMM|nr:hypothetical protein [Candidatus Thiothrix sp. Deng01]MEB4589964.1 hypothetical protein [Candidatus Thiothrix sp. Deng01]
MSKMYIRVADEEEATLTSSGTLSGRGGRKLPPGIKEIDSAELASKMQELSQQLSEVFSKVETVGKFKLNKVELGIEISGEGGINLIANGKVGGKGSIKLVFEPAKP